MSGIATLAGASIDHMTGPIAPTMVTIIGVILLIHSIFDVIPAAIAPVSTGVPRRRATTTVDRLAKNHTPLAYSTPPFTAINRAIANHRSGSNAIGDTSNTPVRGCR